jgi:hypothetical protein
MSDTPQGPDWWLASDGRWYPPSSRRPPPPPQPAFVTMPAPYPQAPSNNGFAIGALSVGVVAVVAGLVPPAFFLAWACGLVAVGLGVVGLRKAREVDGPTTMARAGVILGVVALLCGVVGFVMLDRFMDGFDRWWDEMEMEMEMERERQRQWGD